ncbi:leucine-rich repeat domain-containing protein [Blautia massiliensis]|uniref:leucine-rich repeat domain-containing protein n=1 Tax=Blautia TaxID=572511 RepID=UPI001570E318|nr:MULTISPECIES: leucine-rich repeat domain-containing protein [Blautia]MCC2727224.1 leucine-rich repeat domain-containing protein [Blautia sp. MSK22_86]NSF58317.1 leucine-rich repeat domain-containing protein [Blautia massiliensis (ex Durand et al. 2017)]NSK73695.1 leucine-rich repeat domain-containing protein [Blautia massiliensis (ex Durand et al. 2017)]
MKIDKKILAGLTAVSMLTCGIWMESVFAADTFSAEETKEAVSDTVTDLSAESITGTETEDVPVMDAAEPENKSEISETPEMSDEPAAPDNPETQDTSETPEETELPENEEADIPQEMLPDDQPEAAFEENAASEDMETETDQAEEKSGFCGAEENTVSWSLDESGVLEIAGQGAMNEWQNEEEVPWNGYRDQITEVRIKEGITSIGAYAFADCEKLVKLDIADSVQTIGAFAYFNCSGLSTLTIG